MNLEDMVEQMEAEAREEYGALTADELDELPKIEDDDTRVWLSRVGVDDGMPFDGAVTVEKRINGRWIEVAMFPAGEDASTA